MSSFESENDLTYISSLKHFLEILELCLFVSQMALIIKYIFSPLAHFFILEFSNDLNGMFAML